MAKKILVNYIGKSGGGPAFAYEFAKGLALNGYDIYVIMSEFVDNRKLWDTCDVFKDVYYVKTNRLPGKQYYLRAQLEFMIFGKSKIKSHFADIQFDYVITTMQHLWSLDISKLVNAKRIVWLCHDPVPHSGSGKIDKFLSDQFAKLADDTVVLTKKFIPIVCEQWGLSVNNVHYMPHGRQLMYNSFEPNKTFYSDNNINFLFFGYIREYKGLSVLANAYKRLLVYSDNITLTIAGSGDFSPYKKEFDGLHNVRVVNRYIADNEVGAFFSGPNVVTVMPYLDATQSGVSLTAMEFNSIIIASNTGGLKEQLADGTIGIFCEPGNESDLFEKMRYVVDNYNDLAKIEKTKMRKHLQSIEWKNVTGKLIKELDAKR